MGTRTAVAIRHIAFEDLGVIEPLLLSRGFRIEYQDVGAGGFDPQSASAADLLVVLGGPIGVGDSEAYPFLVDETSVIADRLSQQRPTLGICLGAQLIARSLGASVAATGRVEIGYAPIGLTEAGRDSVLAPLADAPVLHWHGDQFAIPDGAERLAYTPGFPNQAFALGNTTLALQFHLEADYRRIDQWLIGHAHELATNGIDPALIRDDARRYGPALAQRAQLAVEEWLDRLDRDR